MLQHDTQSEFRGHNTKANLHFSGNTNSGKSNLLAERKANFKTIAISYLIPVPKYGKEMI